MFTGRRCGGTPVMSCPSISMRPASGVSKPASRRNRVVLPHPEPPSRANSSPRAISRSTPATASTWPNRLTNPAILTIGPATEIRSPAGLDRGPEPGALAHLLGGAGTDSIEAGPVVGGGIDPGVVRDRLVEQRGRRRVAVCIAGDRAGGGRHPGIEHEVEEAISLVRVRRVLGDRRDVDPEHRALSRYGVGDLTLLDRLRGAGAGLQDVAGVAESEADVPASQRVDVLRGVELADIGPDGL